MSAADVIREIDIAGDEIFDMVIEDALNTMKSLAPHRTGALRGLGSMSTGALRGQIRAEKTSRTTAWVGVRNHPYAQYAENGRGAISKPYPMTFVGADGNIHKAKSVAAMEGWHFVEKTAEHISSKYG